MLTLLRGFGICPHVFCVKQVRCQKCRNPPRHVLLLQMQGPDGNLRKRVRCHEPQKRFPCRARPEITVRIQRVVNYPT